MFFLRYLEREITLHPSFFNQGIQQVLRQRLFSDLEGSCNGEHYVVCIMDIYNISPGKTRPGTGEALFTILYRAILWKPFKGETVDCVVMSVKPQGVQCEAGPLAVFVSSLHLPPGMKYNPDSTPPQYSNNSGDVIEKGTAVRVSIIGMRNDATDIKCVGKMSAQWFGPA